MSASIRPTFAPERASARARLAATVDLPTPPLPLSTATTWRTFGSEIFEQVDVAQYERAFGNEIDGVAVADEQFQERACHLDLLLGRARLRDLGSRGRLGGCDLMTILRNGQAVTDAQLLGRINVIGFGKGGHRYTSSAGDAHERVTRLHHVNASTRLRLCSV